MHGGPKTISNGGGWVVNKGGREGRGLAISALWGRKGDGGLTEVGQ